MSKEQVDFSTIREDLNQYQIENGQILKMKVILTEISTQTGEDGKKRSLLGQILPLKPANASIFKPSSAVSP